MKITNYNIVLGSNSPRRKEILTQMGFKFEVRVSDKEELFSDTLKGKEVSEFLAIQKSDNLKDTLQNNELLITADTIVVHDNQILNKPKTENQAIKMLTSLSSSTHEVITSFCLLSTEKREVYSETTLVTFSELSEESILYYIKKYKPFDKAGSYGIQEWIGLTSIKKIEGSYSNVVGFPTSELYKKITNF